MNISASRLSTFDECRRKWYWKYVLKLPEEIQQDTSALDFGNGFHKIMELSLKAKQKNAEQFSDPYKLISSAIKKYNLKDGSQERLNDYITNCINDGWFINYQNSLSEHEFKFQLNDDICIYGKIDRFDEYDDHIRIVDLKTSKEPYKKDIEKLWQSRIYGLINFHKKKPIKIEYWFVKFKNSKPSAFILPCNENKIKNKIISTVDEMKKEDGTNYTISGLCERFCPFYKKCLTQRN